jgi:hypothetical protein
MAMESRLGWQTHQVRQHLCLLAEGLITSHYMPSALFCQIKAPRGLSKRKVPSMPGPIGRWKAGEGKERPAWPGRHARVGARSSSELLRSIPVLAHPRAAIWGQRATARSGRKRARIPPNAVRYIDMYAVMRAFCEVGYRNTMTLDHTPRFGEGYEAAGTAYAIGYMRSRCFNARWWSGQKPSWVMDRYFLVKCHASAKCAALLLLLGLAWKGMVAIPVWVAAALDITGIVG